MPLDFPNFTRQGLSNRQKLIKRLFDLLLCCCLLIFLFPLLIVGFFVSSLSTRSFGIFLQERVGENGSTFKIYKLKTMLDNGISEVSDFRNDQKRVTSTGHLLRMFKIDEIPQLFNVMKGDMSFVGPRPDVVGFADKLTGEDLIILTVKPGITGPASIKYKDEVKILKNVSNPDAFNRGSIWPDKVRINKAYVHNWTFWGDVKWLFLTVIRQK